MMPPPNPATLRVIFTRNHWPGSILLRAALWSGWSHCALVDGDDIIEAAAFHGVRRRSLHALLSDSSRFAILDIPVKSPAAIIAAAHSQIGKPYDWAGVLGIATRRRWQEDDAWFCSELIAWAFAQGGNPLVRVPAWRITPRDLYLPLHHPPA